MIWKTKKIYSGICQFALRIVSNSFLVYFFSKEEGILSTTARFLLEQKTRTGRSVASQGITEDMTTLNLQVLSTMRYRHTFPSVVSFFESNFVASSHSVKTKGTKCKETKEHQSCLEEVLQDRLKRMMLLFLIPEIDVFSEIEESKTSCKIEGLRKKTAKSTSKTTTPK